MPKLFRIKSERLKLPAPFSRRIAEPLHTDAAGQATFYGCFDKIGREEGEDRERRAEWLDWAKVWNELADDAFGHPLEERIANRSSDLGQM